MFAYIISQVIFGSMPFQKIFEVGYPPPRLYAGGLTCVKKRLVNNNGGPMHEQKKIILILKFYFTVRTFTKHIKKSVSEPNQIPRLSLYFHLPNLPF